MIFKRVSSARRGQFFELDLLFASLLLISGLLLVKPLFIHDVEVSQTDSYAVDSGALLSSMLVGSLDENFLSALELSASPVDIDRSISVARQAVIFLIENKLDSANILINESLKGIIPENYGVNVSVVSNLQRYLLFSRNIPLEHDVSRSQSLLSGLEVNKSVFGYRGSVFLSKRIVNRSSYVFFGGFVGEGNLSVGLVAPVDATNFSLYFEGDLHSDASVFVNNNYCGLLSAPVSPDPFSQITSVSLPLCSPYLISGSNKLELFFLDSSVENNFVGGGFFRANYLSSEISFPKNYVRYYLPGISGVLNLYDGFFVPGTLTSMNSFLHYYSDHSVVDHDVVFSVGNATILFDNSSLTEQAVSFDDSDFSSVLDYGDLSNTTVPIRFGIINGSQLISGGQAFISLITDVSLSMKLNFDVGNNPSELACDELNALGSPTLAQRLLLAKCVDKYFARYVIDNTGAELGIVSFGPVSMTSFDVSDDLSDIISEIDDYDFPINPYNGDDWFGTCTACSIKSAEDMLKDLPSDVPKAMIIMTDGGTNACYRGADYDWLTSATFPELRNFIQNSNHDCGEDAAQNQAVEFAVRAHEDYNISIFAVAYGNAARVTMQEIADATNGSFYLSTNAEELREIYAEIADTVLSSSFNSQVVSVPGSSDGVLFSDSFIEFSYDDLPTNDASGSIIVSKEETPFSSGNCDSVEFVIPPLLSPISASITSYSGDLWTNRLLVNGVSVFNISSFGSNFEILGDPFVLGIPGNLLQSGSNTFSLETASSPSNISGCSPFDKIVYSALLNSTVSVDELYPVRDGCLWSVEFSNSVRSISLPRNYAGSDTCSYSSISRNVFDDSDIWEVIGLELFSSFDFENDGVVDIDFDEFDLDTNLARDEAIPYMWGPAMLDVVVWR